MKAHSRCAGLILATLSIFTAAQAQPAAYVWQSADGDPQEVSGMIVLDSDNNAAGSYSDILSITTDQAYDLGIWDINLSLLLNTPGAMSWTPSGITSLPELDYQQYYFRSDSYLEYATIDTTNCLQYIPETFHGDPDGFWVRDYAYDAPDTTSTLGLLGLTLLGLATIRAIRVSPARQ